VEKKDLHFIYKVTIHLPHVFRRSLDIELSYNCGHYQRKTNRSTCFHELPFKHSAVCKSWKRPSQRGDLHD